MRVVPGTNVLVSRIFFGGQPRAVLDAWAEDRFELLVPPSIFDEYVRTCDRLSASHQGLNHQSALATIIGHGYLVSDAIPSAQIPAHPDDDKFMLCARGHGPIVLSGDKHLLDASVTRRAGPGLSWIFEQIHEPRHGNPPSHPQFHGRYLCTKSK